MLCQQFFESCFCKNPIAVGPIVPHPGVGVREMFLSLILDSSLSSSVEVINTCRYPSLIKSVLNDKLNHSEHLPGKESVYLGYAEGVFLG